MNANRLTGFGLLLLGIGVAASAILGPLVFGVIEFRVSHSMENQLLGGEIISLVAVAPLALLAGILWLRGHPLAPALTVGPASYAVYTYIQFIAGPEYGRYAGNNEYAFPLYLVLVILGWTTALRAWTALGTERLQPLPNGLRRTLAALLLGVNAFFALAWTMSLVKVLGGGTVTQEYRDSATFFWLIRLMDLAFVIPAAFITGVGLLQRRLWATRLGYALAGFQTLLVGSVAGMAVSMIARNDPAASPVMLVVIVALTLALAIVSALALRRAHQSGVQRTHQSASGLGYQSGIARRSSRTIADSRRLSRRAP